MSDDVQNPGRRNFLKGIVALIVGGTAGVLTENETGALESELGGVEEKVVDRDRTHDAFKELYSKYEEFIGKITPSLEGDYTTSRRGLDTAVGSVFQVDPVDGGLMNQYRVGQAAFSILGYVNGNLKSGNNGEIPADAAVAMLQFLLAAGDIGWQSYSTSGADSGSVVMLSDLVGLVEGDGISDDSELVLSATIDLLEKYVTKLALESGDDGVQVSVTEIPVSDGGGYSRRTLGAAAYTVSDDLRKALGKKAPKGQYLYPTEIEQP